MGKNEIGKYFSSKISLSMDNLQSLMWRNFQNSRKNPLIRPEESEISNQIRYLSYDLAKYDDSTHLIEKSVSYHFKKQNLVSTEGRINFGLCVKISIQGIMNLIGLNTQVVKTLSDESLNAIQKKVLINLPTDERALNYSIK